MLLTTPESLESMLVSVNVDHRQFFAGLRAVVVDEVHAFAGDDRGWHLLAVLERLTHLLGRPLQRIGLSATVGNPGELLTWLQGSGAGERPAHVVAPGPPGQAQVVPPGEVQLDYVGSVSNAAKVISALHRGEKRLVFCDSKQLVEELGHALGGLGITVFLSHASLSADERRRSEEAFAEARDCVIIATSTLELGIDVGDLDRVIQINAPFSVASFLQRIGRTGRRAGSVRNCLFLALDEGSLLRAAALLLLWGRGWVEPVTPPPSPGTSWPSRCWRSACRSIGSGTESGHGGGTGCGRSARAPNPSSVTWSRRDTWTRTPGCCSSARRPSGASGSGISWR